MEQEIITVSGTIIHPLLYEAIKDLGIVAVDEENNTETTMTVTFTLKRNLRCDCQVFKEQLPKFDKDKNRYFDKVQREKYNQHKKIKNYERRYKRIFTRM